MAHKMDLFTLHEIVIARAQPSPIPPPTTETSEFEFAIMIEQY